MPEGETFIGKQSEETIGNNVGVTRARTSKKRHKALWRANSLRGEFHAELDTDGVIESIKEVITQTFSKTNAPEPANSAPSK